MLRRDLVGSDEHSSAGRNTLVETEDSRGARGEPQRGVQSVWFWRRVITSTLLLKLEPAPTQSNNTSSTSAAGTGHGAHPVTRSTGQ